MFKDELADLSYWLTDRRGKLRALLHDRHSTTYAHVNVRLSNVYDYTRMLTMAIKGKKGDTPKKADFRGFFNFEMDPEQKGNCKEWIRNEEEVALSIEQAIASGYSVKITLDTNKAGYQATMQANDAKDVNAGLCMSAYAKHWYDALAVLMFKHFVLLSCKWEEQEQASNTEDFG